MKYRYQEFSPQLTRRRRSWVLFCILSIGFFFLGTTILSKLNTTSSDFFEGTIFHRLPKLRAPPTEADVTVVVVTASRNVKNTLRCLQRVVSTTSGFRPSEIIVVDDDPTDATQVLGHLVADVPWVRVMRTASPMGRVGSINAAIRQARSSLIMLLSSDVVVTDSWLTDLIRVFDTHNNVGLVGGKLTLADGRLGQACGIVYSDGRVEPHGLGELDHSKPEHNYLRNSGYCPISFAMVSREALERVGALDDSFSLETFSDADLAVAMRAHGYSVFYQPLATAQTIPSAVFLESPDEATLRENHEKFVAKWGPQGVLERDHPSPTLPPHLSKDWPAQERVLFIDNFPQWDKHAGGRRLFEMMWLSRWRLGLHVTFLGGCAEKSEPYHYRGLQEAGVEFIDGKLAIDFAKNWIESLSGKCHFSSVLIARPPFAQWYIDRVRNSCPNIRVIFDTVDIHFLREKRQLELTTGKPADDHPAVLNTKKIELEAARKANVTLVVTPHDRDFLSSLVPTASFDILSMVDDVEPFTTPFSERSGVLFVGSWVHKPNTDAAVYFGTEVLPALLERIPSLTFHVVGSGTVPDSVRKLEQTYPQSVVIHGAVDDEELRQLHAEVRVFVAPLRFGAGVKGKIVFAMKTGVPVVTTPIGAEGMGLVDGENCLIGDSPAQLAERVAEVYLNEGRWEQLRSKGFDVINNNFSRDVATEALRRLFLPSNRAQ